MYSSSKHGVRYLLKQNKVLPEETPAPTCQTCHMADGDHIVRTAWGFLALRLPFPDDKQWADNRTVILKGLGVFDPDGKPTGRLDAVKGAYIARLTQEDWQKERDKMSKVCSQCHSENFVKEQLGMGDNIIKETDKLMAEAINTVAGLYKDKLIEKPKSYSYSYPALLTFHDSMTSIETKLFVMFLEHRMRTFQGLFHANPDYAIWYGWSAMKIDLLEIKEMAENMRNK
jgi:hydroxylamine dehydrogenase